jgi:aspartyl/asparaginyl beta-hydroxylase (cupin superfamily)
MGRTWGRINRAIDATLARRSLIGTGELIAKESFAWAGALEAHWKEIRGELDAVLTEREQLPAMQTLSPAQYGITREPVWKVFLFTAYGERSAANCARCPITASLIDDIPGLETAFFSILEPGARLKPHRGFYKGLVRAHLGLKVPEPADHVRLKVGRETVVWREGEIVFFDDTFRHAAWNLTTGVRVVLLIDVLRPMTPMMDLLNRAVVRLARLTPPVRHAVKTHRAWEKQFYGKRVA